MRCGCGCYREVLFRFSIGPGQHTTQTANRCRRHHHLAGHYHPAGQPARMHPLDLRPWRLHPTDLEAPASYSLLLASHPDEPVSFPAPSFASARSSPAGEELTALAAVESESVPAAAALQK